MTKHSGACWDGKWETAASARYASGYYGLKALYKYEVVIILNYMIPWKIYLTFIETL